MSNTKHTPIAVGDTITFTTITRYGKQKATRKVVEINERMGIGVRFNGWNPYWLYSSALDRIICIKKATE